MEIHNVTQGSEDWHELRLTHFTASEAPAMLGVSKYQTRDELLREKFTKERKEINPYLQKIFNQGHAAEAGARPIVEEVIGDDLFPVVGSLNVSGLPLLASFDGLTMAEDLVFEHKLLNDELSKCKTADDLPEQYKVQMEQQLRICGADKALFVASNGTKDGMIAIDYDANDERWNRILAGWKQFANDLENYQLPEASKPEPKAEAITALPALVVNISGTVKESTLAVYEETATAYLAKINTNLQTDQDFVDADKAAKFCREAAKKLELVKEQALAQTADIDAIFKSIDKMATDFNAKGLQLEKLVKSEKENRKNEIIQAGQKELDEYLEKQNKAFNRPYIAFHADFYGAVKGLKTTDSYRSAVNDEVSRAKIAIGELVTKTVKNIGTLQTLAAEYRSLFPDLMDIVKKEPDDFTALVKARIADHEAQEADRQAKALAAGEAQKAAEMQRQEAMEQAKPKTETKSAMVDFGENDPGYMNFRAGKDRKVGKTMAYVIDVDKESPDGTIETINDVISVKNDEKLRNFMLEFLQSLEIGNNG